MVFVSTIKAITENSGDTPVTEETPPATGSEASVQELLAQRGIYYRLYQLQYRDQESANPPALSAPPG